MSPPQPSTGLILNLPSAAVLTPVPEALACVLRNPGHLGPGMARCIRKEQLKLQIHFDCFRVDPRRWHFWRGSLPRQEEGWARHLKAQPGPGFMGHWVALSASPSLSFSICKIRCYFPKGCKSLRFFSFKGSFRRMNERDRKNTTVCPRPLGAQAS